MKLEMFALRKNEEMEEFKRLTKLVGRRGISPKLYLGYSVLDTHLSYMER